MTRTMHIAAWCAVMFVLPRCAIAGAGDASQGWGALVGNPGLDDRIRAALADAPSLDASRASLRVAAAAERTARADGRPVLGAHVDVRGGRRRNAITGGEADDLEPLSVGINASWELDVFGRIRAAVGAAEFAQRAQKHMLHDRRLAFAAEIAQRYVEGRFRVGRSAVRREALASHEAIVAYHAGRVTAGLARYEKRERAAAARLLANRSLERADEELAALSARWKYLVPVDDAPPFSGATPLPDSLPRLPDGDTLHAYALKRPDVQAAHALRMQAEQKTKSAVRNRLPSLEAVAMAEGDGPSPVDEPEEWVAWAGARLSLPLTAPGRSAAVELRRGETDVRTALYEETVRRALLDIREAFVKRVHSEKRWRASIDEAAQLKDALDSVNRRFDQGLVPVTTLETARLAWLRADELRRELHAAALQRHVAFVRACGGTIGDRAS